MDASGLVACSPGQRTRDQVHVLWRAVVASVQQCTVPARHAACEVRNVADLVHPAGVGSHVVYIRVVAEQMAQRVMAVEGEDARC